MSPFIVALSVSLLALPLSASAETVALDGAPTAPRACTLTMDFVPKSMPPPNTNAEPVIFVDTTQSYPIRSFTVKRPTTPRAASVATVTADLGMETTVATLLDQHAIIERAELTCPTKNATLTNATIGYIGTFDTANAPALSFTMNFWPKNLVTQR